MFVMLVGLFAFAGLAYYYYRADQSDRTEEPTEAADQPNPRTLSMTAEWSALDDMQLERLLRNAIDGPDGTARTG